MTTFRSFLYLLARFLGDAQAIKSGRVGRRVARRVVGRAAGRAIGRVIP
jgi:hypothetical protein